MGSSSSKDGATARTRVFHSSCLGRTSANNDDDDDLIIDHRNKVTDVTLVHHFPQTTTVVEEEVDEEDEEDNDNDNDDDDPHGILKQQQHHHPRFCGDADINKCDATSSSQHHVSSSSTPPTTTRLRSRFSFIPPNFSFTRLTRAASFGSSSTSYSLHQQHQHQHPPLPSFITTQARDLLPLPPLFLHDSSPPAPHSPPSNALRIHPHISTALSPHPTSNQHNNLHVLPHQHHPISTNENTDVPFTQSRRGSRLLGARQPVERSVRFSRTLSVGRLRDRVLRRSSFTDGLFGRLQQDGEAGSSQENRRQGWAEMTTTPDPRGNADVSPSTSTRQLPPMYNSIYNSQHDELETSRPREARYHDIMEHRTDFLERRRRIRSQVRALQRLGSRFENLSGHERSCILAGQHRSGHCTCRMSSRTRNPDDDTSARASISRIVMLAEALFEVLDEIHQQSVVLSSRASVSSLGSIPAPKEVVESMPVKIYTKLQKHQLEEVAQCYICLVEYEEGDCVRILPCHHEFHKTCIDKWLKEIHRVCPLCRGDVCKSETLSSEN